MLTETEKLLNLERARANLLEATRRKQAADAEEVRATAVLRNLLDSLTIQKGGDLHLT